MNGFTQKGFKLSAVLILIALIAIIAYSPAASAKGGKQIILVFYGGYASHYKIAYPELEKYGFTATFMPITDDIGVGFDEEGNPLLMNWEQLNELQDKGYEIASGGWDFTDSYENKDLLYLSKEIFYSKDKLENHGLRIYGFGKSHVVESEEGMEMIKSQYSYSITEPQIDYVTKLNKETPLHQLHATVVGQMLITELYRIIDSIGLDETVILFYEDIGLTGGRRMVPTDNFIEEMRYLDSMGYKGVSVSDYFSIKKPTYSEFDMMDDALRVIIIILIITLLVTIFIKSGK